MSLAVYIGAGLDVRPIRILKHINHFIYLDSRPYTQQPMFPALKQYDDRYVDDFNSKMFRLDFNIVSNNIEPSGCMSCFEFRDYTKLQTIKYKRDADGCTVTYHYNMAFPRGVNNEVKNTMRNADTLIVAGFFPHACILEYMKTPINIVCMEGTVYDCDDMREDTENTIVQYLHQNENTPDVVSIVYYKKDYVKTEFLSIGQVCRSKQLDMGQEDKSPS